MLIGKWRERGRVLNSFYPRTDAFKFVCKARVSTDVRETCVHQFQESFFTYSVLHVYDIRNTQVLPSKDLQQAQSKHFEYGPLMSDIFYLLITMFRVYT